MSFRDHQGRARRASRDAVVAVLRGLGAQMERATDAPSALAARRNEFEQMLVPTVLVAWDGNATLVHRAARPLDCRLVHEDGSECGWIQPPEAAIELRSLPPGRHNLYTQIDGKTHLSHVVSAPRRLPAPTRTWGVFAPIHALRSARSWGTGDLKDLETLVNRASAWGAGAVSTLPLLASFLEDPFDPSPYAPASRLFWNELYVEPHASPELERCEAARELLASPGFRDEIERLRSTDLVDYRESFLLKRKVLELLARCFFKESSERRRGDLDRFLGRNELADEYARFRSQGSPESHAYHLYAQLLADDQMQSLAAHAATRGVRLYLDLPVGAHPASYDVWRFGGAFASGASVGAPPDAFFAGGQDWGFPPLHPVGSGRDGHDYFARSVRHLTQYGGVVRIDHVVGMHRLYWIPQGMDATEGVYVRYPADELYAVLVLEASRNGTTLVGEDLGTVPRGVRTAMRRRGVLRTYVLPLELSGPVWEPNPVPRDAVASLSTHDTETFATWWSSLDDDQRRALAGSADSETSDALRKCLDRITRSRSPLLVVNLEDLWGETRPQNVPGSSGDENPNWRRKMAKTLEEIARDGAMTEALRHVGRSRGVTES